VRAIVYQAIQYTIKLYIHISLDISSNWLWNLSLDLFCRIWNIYYLLLHFNVFREFWKNLIFRWTSISYDPLNGRFINDVHQKIWLLDPPPPLTQNFNTNKVFLYEAFTKTCPKLWTSFVIDPIIITLVLFIN
jgi:hypothetical protein